MAFHLNPPRRSICRNNRRSPAPTTMLKKIVSCVNRNENGGQGRVKIAEEAALPPDVRKASGFPGQTTSLVPLGWKAEPSSRAERVSQGRSRQKGKAFPRVRRQSRFGTLPFGDFDAPPELELRGCEKIVFWRCLVGAIRQLVDGFRAATRAAPTTHFFAPSQALLGGIVLGMRGANGLGAGFHFSGRRAPLHLAKKKSKPGSAGPEHPSAVHRRGTI